MNSQERGNYERDQESNTARTIADGARSDERPVEGADVNRRQRIGGQITTRCPCVLFERQTSPVRSRRSEVATGQGSQGKSARIEQTKAPKDVARSTNTPKSNKGEARFHCTVQHAPIFGSRLVRRKRFPTRRTRRGAGTRTRRP